MNKESIVLVLKIAGYFAAWGIGTGIVLEAVDTIDLIRSDKKLIKSYYDAMDKVNEVHYGGSKA